jgi:hypothetical protein
MSPHQYHQFVGSHSSGGISVFWGAFFGAFFAFIFGIVTYVITKRRERFVQHKNSLIKMERVLNKHLDDLGLLQSIVQDTKRIVDGHKVTSNRLFYLQLPENIDMEIGSLDIINKFFTYRTSIDRFKLNVESVNHALTRLEDLFIGGQPVLVENFDFIKSTLEKFIEEIPSLNERTTKFLVLVRIHINKLKNKNTFIQGLMGNQWDQNISKEEIDKENHKLEAEISQLRQDYENDIF